MNGHVEGFFNSRMSWSMPAAMMRVEAGGGLVEEKDFGVHGECASDSGALFHAATQLGGEEVLKAREADLIEFQADHDFDGAWFQLSMLFEWQGHVLAYGHGTKSAPP